MKFVDNVATKTKTKLRKQEVEKREMHDRGGCQSWKERKEGMYA